MKELDYYTLAFGNDYPRNYTDNRHYFHFNSRDAAILFAKEQLSSLGEGLISEPNCMNFRDCCNQGDINSFLPRSCNGSYFYIPDRLMGSHVRIYRKATGYTVEEMRLYLTYSYKIVKRVKCIVQREIKEAGKEYQPKIIEFNEELLMDWAIIYGHPNFNNSMEYNFGRKSTWGSGSEYRDLVQYFCLSDETLRFEDG